jgi:hypothetical protein
MQRGTSREIEVVHALCLEQHQNPGLPKGAQKTIGQYFRCLRKGDVVRRYGRDNAAAFGYRVRAEEWRWKENEIDQGLKKFRLNRT